MLKQCLHQALNATNSLLCVGFALCVSRRNIGTFDSISPSRKRSSSPRKSGRKCTCSSPTPPPFPSFHSSEVFPRRETALCAECRKAEFYSNFVSMGHESVSETPTHVPPDAFSPARDEAAYSKYLQNRGNLSDSAYLLSKVNMSALNGDGFIVSTPVNAPSEPPHSSSKAWDPTQSKTWEPSQSKAWNNPQPTTREPTQSRLWDPTRVQMTAEELWRRVHSGSFAPSELMTSGLRACQRRERLLLDPEIRDLWTRPQS